VWQGIRDVVVTENVSIGEYGGSGEKLVEDDIQYVAGTQARSLRTGHPPVEILTVLVQENRGTTTNVCTKKVRRSAPWHPYVSNGIGDAPGREMEWES